jgi:CubicO group peptidase (beta-lactamase class C family)
MKKLSRPYIVVLSVIINVFAANAQHGAKIDSLTKYIEDARIKWNIPAVAVGIIHNDSIILLKGYGEREIGTGKKVDENTLFAVASNTKSFTATAMGILVDDGKVKWDDPVTQYLPWFKLYDPYVSQNFTIRDLLTHKSGLATFSGDLIWYGSTHSREEVVRRAAFLIPHHGFRTDFGYSNIMYLAAGLVIEQVSGMSWDAFIKERILDPIHMDRTNSSTLALDIKGNTAIPHSEADGKVIAIPYLNWDNIAPAGSINSSAAEMLKWIKLQLDNGKFQDKQLVSPAVLHQMWAPQTSQTVSRFSEKLWPSTHFKSYGMGWGLMDYHGKKVISHSGGYDGMISYSAFVPEADLGFVILTNKNSSLYYPLAYKIMDAFLSSDEFDWSGYFFDLNQKNEEASIKESKKLDSLRIVGTHPTLPLDKFCGTYHSEMYGDVVVEMQNGALNLKFMPTPIFHAPLTHWEYNTFSLKFPDVPSLPAGKAAFIIGMGDKVESLKIDVPNPDFDFTELDLVKID